MRVPDYDPLALWDYLLRRSVEVPAELQKSYEGAAWFWYRKAQQEAGQA